MESSRAEQQSQPARLAPEGPAWIRETIALGHEEARRFVATAVAILSRPGRFGADWFAGRQRALNPLGFVATALALSSAVGLLMPGGDGNGLMAAISIAMMPYVYYAGVGILCHPLLRLAGSKRRLSASLAVALFAGGGPGLVIALSMDLLIALRIALFGHFQQSVLRGVPHWAIGPGALLAYGPFFYYVATLALALAGLHAVGRVRAVGAVVISLVLTGLALGVAHRFILLSLGVPHFVIYVNHYVPIPDIWF
jgi:hypothetical protein